MSTYVNKIGECYVLRKFIICAFSNMYLANQFKEDEIRSGRLEGNKKYVQNLVEKLEGNRKTL
jgi:hypothetical protein